MKEKERGTRLATAAAAAAAAAVRVPRTTRCESGGGEEETTECVARRPRGHIPVNMIGFCRTAGKDIIIIIIT